jgi:hypothetical protein
MRQCTYVRAIIFTVLENHTQGKPVFAFGRPNLVISRPRQVELGRKAARPLTLLLVSVA